MIELFKQYPRLGSGLPHVSLGEFPTPVHRLDGVAGEIDAGQVYIKRDDLSGKVYGGNKIRKYEFILGRAIRSGKNEVMTFGLAGSKAPMAAAICARKAGLRSILMVTPDSDGAPVRRNVLVEHYYGSGLHQYGNILLLELAAGWHLLSYRLNSGHFPVIIRGSRSCPLGTIGYVNAGFELKKQVLDGEVPEPDRIYVAMGTMGTAVGLVIGLKAAGLKSRVVAVSASGEKAVNARKMKKLFVKTVGLLHSADPSFPRLELSTGDIDIRHDSYVRNRGFLTERETEVRSRMEKSEGIELDEIYTSRVLACLVKDADNGDLRDKVVLFWNTYDPGDFSDILAAVDYRKLPRSFHRYFE